LNSIVSALPVRFLPFFFLFGSSVELICFFRCILNAFHKVLDYKSEKTVKRETHKDSTKNRKFKVERLTRHLETCNEVQTKQEGLSQDWARLEKIQEEDARRSKSGT
jgi:hypothetical protein